MRATGMDHAQASLCTRMACICASMRMQARAINRRTCACACACAHLTCCPTGAPQVLRLDRSGRARASFTRRRDLLREYKLLPRDLRRIDPAVEGSRTPASIITKDNVILMCLGGVRAIVTGEKALLFEPDTQVTRKFLEIVLQHMQVCK